MSNEHVHTVFRTTLEWWGPSIGFGEKQSEEPVDEPPHLQIPRIMQELALESAITRIELFCEQVDSHRIMPCPFYDINSVRELKHKDVADAVEYLEWMTSNGTKKYIDRHPAVNTFVRVSFGVEA